MRLATLTSNQRELQELIPILRELYFHGGVELLSFVNTEQEALSNALLSTHRRLREYLQPAVEAGVVLQDKLLLEACRNALQEERPDIILWPTQTLLRQALSTTIQQYGIGEYQLGQGRSVELERFFTEQKTNSAAKLSKSRLDSIVANLKALDLATEPVASGLVKAEKALEAHWETLREHLESPCLLLTTPPLERTCREKFPEVEFHTDTNQGPFPCGLALFEAGFSENPEEPFALLTEHCQRALSLEPVNSPLAAARYNFRYGLYDNEFALAKAELDLKTHLPANHQAQIWSPRKGNAGSQSPPHPDGKYPLVFSRWPATSQEWTARYTLPEGEHLRVVFLDSGNVAGSALHHAEAVNRFTDSQAWAVTGAPHPFIGPRKSNESTLYLNQDPDRSHLEKVISGADCVVFFEDDDEDATRWPFPLAELIEQTAIVHLYIGYRVHAKTPKLARPGRLILTPLPHLLKMYPESEFYAGFPPYLEESENPSPPRSASDGICRFLHTPSLPHWTTSRYPYHKDTEAFFRAARDLKSKFGSKVEFHQVGGWSHKEVVAARLACDVTFNQLRGFHGLSGDEAMMLGRPCVQFFDQFNINRHLEYWGLDVDFPWLNCTAETLSETFEKLLLNPDLREQVGQHSRDFMRKYFSPRKGILPLLYHCYRAKRGRLERTRLSAKF